MVMIVVRGHFGRVLGEQWVDRSSLLTLADSPSVGAADRLVTPAGLS